jgi:hypothetical protein
MLVRKWTLNGLLVQDLSKINLQSSTNYLGIERFHSWPLSCKTDIASKTLTEEAEDKWFNYFYDRKQTKYSLAVVPSIEYIQRYLSVCQKYKLNVRVLFVETDREDPVWDGPYYHNKFLGFDYGTTQDFFSVLYDDMYGKEDISLFIPLKLALNKYGLFNTENELNSYINAREEAIKEGHNLEETGDFCRFKISTIDLNHLYR